MITAPDFSKKQIVVVFFNEGEKIALSNSNMIVKAADGTIKFQCTCYRIFLVIAIGHCNITSAIIQASKKFGFFIALMSVGFRLYSMIGAEKDSNYLLHKKQYAYDGLDIAKHITINKITNQCNELKAVRNKSDAVKEAIVMLESYALSIPETETLNELMAYEGLASKIYFRNHFNNIEWKGRQPRVKRDYVNSSLDIGYTLLFSLIESITSAYGFDNYCGVMHRQFYMRKSFVCDMVEPFRPIIDHTIKRAINLKQIQEDDFIDIKGQKQLKYEKSSKYVKLFLEPLLKNKDNIFLYVQNYYRAFMKDLAGEDFPIFEYGE